MSHLMFLAVPLFIVIQLQVLFFICTTPLILYKLYNVIVSYRFFTKFENMIRISNQILWLLFHMSFMLLYIVDRLPNEIIHSDKIS